MNPNKQREVIKADPIKQKIKQLNKNITHKRISPPAAL